MRKILRTQNCRRKFIKNLLPKKRKESMETKQPRFISRLNKSKAATIIELIVANKTILSVLKLNILLLLLMKSASYFLYNLVFYFFRKTFL